MAVTKLYSQDDVNRLLEVAENWVPITEPVLKKGATVWDGNEPVIYKVINYHATHPDIGRAYALRDLHTGVSTIVSLDAVHATYRRFRLSEDAQRLREAATPATYKVCLVVQGATYEAKEPADTSLNAAIALANQYRAISGQETYVRNLKTNEIAYRATAAVADPPTGQVAPQPVSDEAIAELRQRKTVRFVGELLIPGVLVKHPTSGEFFVYLGPSANDKSRHIFANLQTGKEQDSIPQVIAEGLYQAMVPRASDLVDLIPFYPRAAFAAIYRLYGDMYKDDPAPVPTGPPATTAAPDALPQSRRAVGQAAAERNIVKPSGKERYAVQYFQRNWMGPRFYEKQYKSEYQATRRAESLLAAPDVLWTAVYDTHANERILVFPPGADVEGDVEHLGGDQTYHIRLFREGPNRWEDYHRAYKSRQSAENRARSEVATSPGVVRAEVIEQPSGRTMLIVNREGADLKLYGIIDPENFDAIETAIGKWKRVPPGGIQPTPQRPEDAFVAAAASLPRPTPARAPEPPIAPRASPEAEFQKLTQVVKPELRQTRTTIQEELSLTVARKLVSLACVAVVSKYDVSVTDATVICQESGEMLNEIADQLARNKIGVYEAIAQIDRTLVETYSLKDVRVAPAPKVVEGVGGELSEDLVPIIQHSVQVGLSQLANARRDLVRKRAGPVTKGELTEVAIDWALGKRKRNTARADLTMEFIEPGTATPDALWNDYQIVADESKGGLIATFDVGLTGQGYVLNQPGGKTRPGKGFFRIVSEIRRKYQATVVVQEDKDRVDIDQLL